MKDYICKDCLSVGVPVKVTKNPELKSIARAANARYGFAGSFILGAMASRDRPLGCLACSSINIVPADTPMGKILSSQIK